MHLLLSIFQEVEKAEIVNNNLVITFLGENFKEILENLNNKNKINDIIKEKNLKISYIFSEEETKLNTEDILKQKFKNLIIKE